MLVIPCGRGGPLGLTPKMMRDIVNRNEERVLSLSAIDAVEQAPSVQAAETSFVQFCGLDSSFKLLLNIRSPFMGSHCSAPSTEQGVSGDHETGRVSLTPKRFAELARLFGATYVVPPHDSPAIDDPPTKKRRTAIERTSKWTREVQASLGSDVTFLAPWTCVAAGHQSISGAISCDGALCDFANQNEVLSERVVRITDVVTQLSNTLGPKANILCPCESVPALLLAASAGATLLECSLPWTLAERGQALNLALTLTGNNSCVDSSATILDLNDPQYALDDSPLATSSPCRCFTCARHSRAYLHHLLTVQEMNSSILLTIHNLTVIIDLLRIFRERADSDVENRNAWVASFLAQFTPK